MVFQNDILAGSSGASGASSVYQIDQSIRFNEDEDSRMGRTPSATGSEETWTWSCWVKRGQLGLTLQILFQIGSNKSNCDQLYFNSSNQLVYQHLDSGSNTDSLTTTQVFRDTSAWYHIVLTADTTNTVESERIRIYVNGERVTDFSGTPNYPTKDTPTDVNTQVLHQIGAQLSSSFLPFDGYMAEIVLIDGTALDPTSFGEETSDGIWKPIDVSGLTFGTNGFYIKGEDSSDLGNDSSGNSNDFTTSGLAVHDQVADSPTNNFCVINPNNTNSSVTISNGNLQSTASAFSGVGTSILLPTTGKWYCEFRYNNASAGEYPVVGVYNTIKNLTTTAISPGKGSGDLDVGFGADGRRNEDDTNTSSWGNSVGDNKIGAIAIDTENKKIWFGHNNSGSFVWQASGDPSAGTNEANTKDFADDLIFGNSHYVGSILVWNFGQDGTFGGTETAQGNADGNGVGNFYYAPPTGFLALCTKNIGAD